MPSSRMLALVVVFAAYPVPVHSAPPPSAPPFLYRVTRVPVFTMATCVHVLAVTLSPVLVPTLPVLPPQTSP